MENSRYHTMAVDEIILGKCTPVVSDSGRLTGGSQIQSSQDNLVRLYLKTKKARDVV